jgi:recombination protein RecT
MKNLEPTKANQVTDNNVNSQIADALQKAFDKVKMLIGKTEAYREMGYARQLVEKNPSLMKCSLQSITDAIVNGSRAKVTLNPSLKLAYLIPRKGVACLEISYMGLITILKKSGGCKYIEAFVVYEDELFKYNPAMGTIEHHPVFCKTEEEQKKRKIVGAYSRAVLTTNEVVYCYIPYWELEKIKRFSANSKDSSSVWNIWEEEMIKKSVIKRHFKFLVSDSEMNEVVEALRIEEENNVIQKPQGLFDLNFD